MTVDQGVMPAPARDSARGVGVRAGSAGVALMVLGATVWLVTHPPPWLSQPRTVLLTGVAWIAFGVAAWLVRGLPRRTAVGLILVGGVALPLLAGFGPPRSSDDLYRYIWDGQVQVAGVDPYRHAPAAPELIGLRDGYLWPETADWCVPLGSVDHENGQPLAAGCTRINRPTVHTIYPPVAEAYFAGVELLSPPGAARHGPIQLGAVLFAVGTTLLLLGALPRLRIDPRNAALWAWCPTVAVEAGNNAHIDVVAAFLAGAALVTLARSRTRGRIALGGALLGLAVATKLTPALLGPALVRRRPVVVAAAAAGAIVTVYLPHVLAVGVDVLGYLPGYLAEEGYTNGDRFALLTLVLPKAWATPAAVAILLAVAIAVARTADPDRPWRGATVMTGTAILVATPAYPWYGIVLVLLVAFDGRGEWLAVAAAGYLALYARDLDIAPAYAQRLGYGLALLVVAVVTVLRTRRTATAVPLTRPA